MHIMGLGRCLVTLRGNAHSELAGSDGSRNPGKIETQKRPLLVSRAFVVHNKRGARSEVRVLIGFIDISICHSADDHGTRDIKCLTQ